jgi:hypothetical protein
VARAAFLADTSAFTRFAKLAVVAAVAPLIAQGQVALTAHRWVVPAGSAD